MSTNEGMETVIDSSTDKLKGCSNPIVKIFSFSFLTRFVISGSDCVAIRAS